MILDWYPPRDDLPDCRLIFPASTIIRIESFPDFEYLFSRFTISLSDKRKGNSFRTYTFSSVSARDISGLDATEISPRHDTLLLLLLLLLLPCSVVRLNSHLRTFVRVHYKRILYIRRASRRTYTEECVSRRGISRRAVEKVNRIDGVNDDVPHSARLRYVSFRSHCSPSVVSSLPPCRRHVPIPDMVHGYACSRKLYRVLFLSSPSSSPHPHIASCHCR